MTTAEDVDLAHKWIDFYLQKRILGQMSERLGWANTAEASDIDYADQLIFLQPPEDFAKRVDIYTQIKAEMMQ